MNRFSRCWVGGVILVTLGWLGRSVAADESPNPPANAPPTKTPSETFPSPFSQVPNGPGLTPPAAGNATGDIIPPDVDGHGTSEPLPKIAAPRALTTKEGKKGWKVTLPGKRPLATPAVVAGKLFIGGGFGSHEFYAFDARTGKMLWQYRTADDGPTAAVVAGGCVVFNTESCELEILGLDGKPKWKKWLGDPLMSMPAVADGQLFMAFPNSRGNREHYLACFDLKTGQEQWRRKVAGEIITAPMVDDGQVFLATLEGTLYCFHARDGSYAWIEEKKNATSAPTLWNGRCWFSRRSEATVSKANKQVKQQIEQVAHRELTAKAEVHDLASTARKADYLDYGKRSAFGGMGGMAASPKEAFSQSADAGVGFSNGNQGPTPNQNNSPAPQKSGPFADPPAPAQSEFPSSGGKGDAKIEQAQSNLGQGSVHGVWSYQGSKPLFYERRLYAAMGDALLCVDPKTEKLLWKKEFPPPKKTPAKGNKAKKAKAIEDEGELLDATVAPPALVNHKVFVGTSYGEVVCLSADTGETIWKATIGGSIVFQPAVAEGRVFVSTEAGVLCCLETGDPNDDGWLMWGANAAHSGTVQTLK